MPRDPNALRRALSLYCNKCFQSLPRCTALCQSQQVPCCTQNSAAPISSTQVSNFFSNLWVRGFSSFSLIDSADQSDEPSSSCASDPEAESKTTNFNSNVSKKSHKYWRQGGDSNDRKIKDKTQNRNKDIGWREWKVKEKDKDKGRVSFSRNKNAVKKTLRTEHVKQRSKQKQGEVEEVKGTLKSKNWKKKLKAGMVDEDEEELDDDIPFENDVSIEKWFTPLSAEEKEQRTQDLEKAFLEVSGQMHRRLQTQFRVVRKGPGLMPPRLHLCGIRLTGPG